jgi:hypothetical protein
MQFFDCIDTIQRSDLPLCTQIICLPAGFDTNDLVTNYVERLINITYI